MADLYRCTDLTRVIGKQCLESNKIVALDEQIAAARIAHRHRRIALYESVRDLAMVV
jgi:hypothetical protein